jgi:preprotein translocase subunit SecF
MKTYKGFSLVELLVIVGVLILIGGLGFVGWRSFNKSTDTSTGTPVSNSESVEVITNEEDLDEAAKQLDSLEIEDEDSAQAESQAAL